MFHYVYIVKHPQTGEFYYGSRTSSVFPELDDYKGSMCKWKVNKFELIKTIVKTFNSREETYLFEREIILKNISHTLNRNYAIPSKHGAGALPGSRNSFFGKKHNNESLIKMKENSNNSGVNNPMFGKKHSAKSKKKMSIKKIGVYNGVNNPMAKKIYQYDIDGNLINIWDCATLCVNHYHDIGIKLSRGNISNTAKNNSVESTSLKRVNTFIFSFSEIDIVRFNKFKNK